MKDSRKESLHTQRIISLGQSCDLRKSKMSSCVTVRLHRKMEVDGFGKSLIKSDFQVVPKLFGK